MNEKVRICVMVSGGGTNLQAILDAEKSGALHSGTVALVISNKRDAFALKRAEAAGVETAVLVKKEPGGQEAFEQAILDCLAKKRIDLIVLAGFLSILSERFTKRYDRRILNVHPSLIPSFCGKGFYGLKVHEAALARGVKVTGATVHFVNEIPDGGEILLQKAVEIQPDDTPEILQKRVMEQAEWVILPQAVETVSAAIREKQEKSYYQGGTGMDIYAINDIAELIKDNPYVGRGIVTGCTRDGTRAAVAYFIMGRSANSRNRVFTVKNGEVFTEPFDASKVQDPSLIIYAAVRSFENNLIVTNGDQTDTVCDALKAGGTFSGALESRCFEPDVPNFTPRISSMLTFEKDSFRYQMSILKSVDAEGSDCARYTFAYPAKPGLGHFIHTYVTDGNPIPTFQGEPERVAVGNDIDVFTNTLWNALNEQNKISLYVRFTDWTTGEAEERLINKNR